MYEKGIEKKKIKIGNCTVAKKQINKINPTKIPAIFSGEIAVEKISAKIKAAAAEIAKKNPDNSSKFSATKKSGATTAKSNPVAPTAAAQTFPFAANFSGSAKVVKKTAAEFPKSPPPKTIAAIANFEKVKLISPAIVPENAKKIKSETAVPKNPPATFGAKFVKKLKSEKRGDIFRKKSGKILP